ncbi:hypothetical protein [Flexibacterium corallicola]|uniref:hypothetical protein n=1 Tax=Flexibacterium corallicola TaxID=3037259 RepID=UPI00286F69F1|nr:hypothetical protein [Pseudovibrio sp. M1P-2-3]
MSARMGHLFEKRNDGFSRVFCPLSSAQFYLGNNGGDPIGWEEPPMLRGASEGPLEAGPMNTGYIQDF